MSKFHTDTNIGRVAKMADMVSGPLTKSAKSNKASAEDMNELFEPLIAALQELGVEVSYDLGDAPEEIARPMSKTVGGAERVAPDGTAREAGSNKHAKGEYKPLWSSVEEMAQQAPLEDLKRAVTVYEGRLEDMYYEVKDAAPEKLKENLMPQAELAEDDDLDDDDDVWD